MIRKKMNGYLQSKINTDFYKHLSFISVVKPKLISFFHGLNSDNLKHITIKTWLETFFIYIDLSSLNIDYTNIGDDRIEQIENTFINIDKQIEDILADDSTPDFKMWYKNFLIIQSFFIIILILTNKKPTFTNKGTRFLNENCDLYDSSS